MNEPTTAEAAPQSQLVEHALGALVQCEIAVEAHDRTDLAQRIKHATHRLEDPSTHLLVVGEFKQGKSSLINALLDAPVCPVDDDIATSAPTAVRFADPPSAAVLYRPPESADGTVEPEREAIPVDRVQEFVTEAANPENERRVHSVEIGVSRPLLSEGLVLVDTPGVGGLGSAHAAITVGALPMADALVFVSDASQEYSGPELQFLETARSLCPNIVCVLTKTDFYPEWRKILDLDRAHLEQVGIEAEILPLSSTLRLQALETGDRELDEESGFPALVDYVQREVIAAAEQLAVNAAVNDALAVVEQLDGQFRTEKAALDEPEQAGALVCDLETAKERADRLRSQAAKWQVTLADGIADLNADVDHDLRTRVRRIVQESDEAIEATDPADIWEEFEPWLYRRVGEDVVNNYKFLQVRGEELSQRVATHFEVDSADIRAKIAFAGAFDVGQAVDVDTGINTDTMSAPQKLWTGVRGGYMGVIMLSMFGGMVGLTLGPLLPLAAGLVLGRKSLRDEKERQLTIRRQQAKNAFRKYVDEAQFVVGKDSRDRLRMIQRQLRDHYSSRAEEFLRSLSETQRAAQAAVQSDQATRQQRQRAVQGELERISVIRKSIREVAAEAAKAGAAIS
ncbi:MAG: dynamin family protein [Acidimicrobiia bacterium]